MKILVDSEDEVRGQEPRTAGDLCKMERVLTRGLDSRVLTRVSRDVSEGCHVCWTPSLRNYSALILVLVTCLCYLSAPPRLSLSLFFSVVLFLKTSCIWFYSGTLDYLVFCSWLHFLLKISKYLGFKVLSSGLYPFFCLLPQLSCASRLSDQTIE